MATGLLVILWAMFYDFGIDIVNKWKHGWKFPGIYGVKKKPGRVTICLFGSLWEINSLAHQNCNRQKWGHATVFFCHQKFEMRDEKGIQNISNTRPHQNGNCTEKNDFTVPNLLELPISQNPCRNHAKTIPLLTTERSGPFWYTSFRAKQTQDNKKNAVITHNFSVMKKTTTPSPYSWKFFWARTFWGDHLCPS